MAFMISRETENVASKKDVEDAFKALTADGDKPYIIGSELYQVRVLKLLISINLACNHNYIKSCI